jgi:hypothetical protein
MPSRLHYLTLRIPAVCDRCKSIGSPLLQQSHREASVLLNWSCRVCGARWAIAPLYDENEDDELSPLSAIEHRVRADRSTVEQE